MFTSGKGLISKLCNGIPARFIILKENGGNLKRKVNLF